MKRRIAKSSGREEIVLPGKILPGKTREPVE